MSARLAVTVGDPRGIGPEIISKALADSRIGGRSDLVVVGPRGCGVEIDEEIGVWKAGSADTAEAGRLSGRAIERAVELASSRAVEGIVTAPIDKAALLAGGYDFPGHTEMLAMLTGRAVAMMLAAARASTETGTPLRVVLATTHIALRDVPTTLTTEKIVSAAVLTRDYLTKWFGIESPRIALCALNPHGGDGGRFGFEDQTILAPAARQAAIGGPYPADTVFVRAMRGEFDAVIAPYHDVGMTAIKVAAFGSAVNITLGLPFPRTSPDHGTALDIAGRGVADPSSFIEALLLCRQIAARDPRSGGRPRSEGQRPATQSSALPSPAQ